MTLLDIIEVYNINNGNDLNDITAIYEDIELDSRLDKEVLAGVLLDECGAMTSIYNVTSTFKYFSNLFFKKYKWNIKKLVDTLEAEYDPLKNRSLEWTETSDIQQNLVTDEDVSESRTKGNTGTQTKTLDEKVEFSEDNSKSSDFDSTETNTVSAMNSNNYLPDTQRVVDSTTSENGEVSSTDETDATSVRTDNLTETIAASTDRDKNEDLDWDETDTHEESGTVNTDYQTLIEKERKVAQFSIYGWIAKKYAKELFLLVY